MNIKLNAKSWSVWIYRTTCGVEFLPEDLCSFFWKWLLAIVLIPFTGVHLLFTFLLQKIRLVTLGASDGWMVIWGMVHAIGALGARELIKGELVDPVSWFQLYVWVFPLSSLIGWLFSLVLIGLGFLIKSIRKEYIQSQFLKHQEGIRTYYDTFIRHHWNEPFEEYMKRVSKSQILKLYKISQKGTLKEEEKVTSSVWQIIGEKLSSAKERYCPRITWLNKDSL